VPTEPLSPPPSPTGADLVVHVAAGAASAIPLVGGPVERVIEAVFGPPYDRRLQKWLIELHDAVRKIEERADRPIEEVVNDPAFLTAVFDATRIAVGEHLDEKLRMLKACLVNMALPHDLPDFLAMRFLRFVDELDPEHFLVLAYARDPATWLRDRGLYDQPATLTPRNLIERAELGLPGPVLTVALQDLVDRQLVRGDHLGRTPSGSSLYDPIITHLGRDLLDWLEIV
jgi:hypothetical protein